mmetsp:Transcript_24037/g.50707  ORF Transcript_24037/g.50707 Transcript_24037/m.50707 type:complete len:426 (-) Transcript_24037:156-1433(-)|eukprot:CAMPEP_0171342428 /NCGR_PEP_ID=MMETSP0878-20121228/14260_1 /TAXON_ID=67004 /ORGANISM="Thalassiosira weissflogii, Strain CCMP1336" /LENGTH=425 /DNA_ID=CAMNT_0011845091 /DNA_START=67 /DNA_END=1344 /DNA_ORIENTATION=-
MFPPKITNAKQITKQSLIYWLFDALVLTSLAYAFWRRYQCLCEFFRDDAPAGAKFRRGEDPFDVSHPPGDPELNPLHEVQNTQQENSFQAGDFVEIFDSKIYGKYAFPAQITSVRYHDGDHDVDRVIGYDILPGSSASKAIIKNVAPSLVSKLPIHDVDSKVMCAFPAVDEKGRIKNDPQLIPCKIISTSSITNVSENNGNGGLYSVSYNLNGNEFEAMHSRAKIWSIVKQGGNDEKIDDPSSNSSCSSSHRNNDVSQPSSSDCIPKSRKSNASAPDITPEYEPGNLVELYNPTSMTSSITIPARITGISGQHNSKELDAKPSATPRYQVRYDLINVITRSPIPGIPSNFLRPYVPYPRGASAHCNIGAESQKLNMVPCTIVSSSSDDGMIVTYTVSLVAIDGKKTEGVLPYSRVQRFFIEESKG